VFGACENENISRLARCEQRLGLRRQPGAEHRVEQQKLFANLQLGTVERSRLRFSTLSVDLLPASGSAAKVASDLIYLSLDALVLVRVEAVHGAGKSRPRIDASGRICVDFARGRGRLITH
jgi:hypothetical protein